MFTKCISAIFGDGEHIHISVHLRKSLLKPYTLLRQMPVCVFAHVKFSTYGACVLAGFGNMECMCVFSPSCSLSVCFEILVSNSASSRLHEYKTSLAVYKLQTVSYRL